MEPDGKHLRVGAANSVPDAYNEACKHGIPVGDFQGSCGTAAFRRKAVIVADIETDPLWDVPPRPHVIAMGLRACWSMPILDDDGAVLGTVAMYYNERREPTGREWGLLEPAARLIRLALAQQSKKDELSQAELKKREAAALEHTAQVIHHLVRLGLDPRRNRQRIIDRIVRKLSCHKNEWACLDGMAVRRDRLRRVGQKMEDRLHCGVPLLGCFQRLPLAASPA